MTTKRVYARPAMQVVELKQHGMLMISGERRSSAGVTNYDWNEYNEE